MEVGLYRLGDAAAEAPYYANLTTVRLIPRHRRLDYADIVLVVGGSGRHVSYGPAGAERMQPLRPGQMALYRPRDELAIIGDEREGLTIRHVGFPIADWESFSSFVGVDSMWARSDVPPVTALDPDDATAVRAFEHALERYWDGPTMIDLVRFWIDVIPPFFQSHRRRADGAGAPLWLAASLAAMREPPNLRGGVARFTQLARVTPSHLASMTRRHYGKTPTELVANLRLRHAAVLLSTTQESIGAIASSCGFGTFSYFSDSFRRRYGLTPRAFRARAFGRLGGT